MIRRYVMLAGILALLGALGCGGSNPPLSTAPLTEEQKAKIKQEDQKVSEEEGGGFVTSTPKKKKK